ncbi:MAG: 1-(5-phosphoribosyl)-5-[(5-phosphoribosylamino)methylideneamino]imidazole-4-carboxamide isomerase [Acidimicrobiales bacterium]
MTPPFELYPAVDLRDGRVVRLEQGDFARQTVYADDPVVQARTFAAAGAAWIHVVDLDAARTGEPVNRPVIGAVCAAVRAEGVRVQAGGGVRDPAAAQRLFELGVERVVIGTAAVENPTLIAEVAAREPGRVAVGLDVRDREVAVRGWVDGTGRDVFDVTRQLAGCGAAAFVVTQIVRDGTLAGPDLDGLAALLAASEVPVIASGGVGSLDDLAALARLRSAGRELAGAVVGKALYAGRFGLAEAFAVIREARAASAG